VTGPQNTSVTAVADEYVAALAPVEPNAAAVAGLEPSSPFPGFAPDDFDLRRAAADRALAALGSEPPADPVESALTAALRERLTSDNSLDDAGFTQSLLAPLATPVHAVRSVFDKLPATTAADWQALAGHLHGVGPALDAYRATLSRSADRGHIAAPSLIAGVAAQCRGWIADDGFYTGLVGRAPEAARPAVAAGVTAARAGTAAFADFLSGELLPRSDRPERAGRERYACTAAAFLGAQIDLDETYGWGWAELDRIGGEIDRLAGELHPDGFEAAAAALDADPHRRLGDPDAVQSWLQQGVAGIADHVDGVHLDLVPRARVPDCRISTSGSGVMYYAPPDPGLTRTGQVWWTAEPGAVVHTWRETTTLHHEGVPGHHTQITTALTARDLHPWQRALCHVHGYAEGWAHHAEEWAGDIGLLDDPGDRLGMLLGQAWRAARIVIDAGLHLDLPIPEGRLAEFGGPRRWTVGLGVAYLGRISGISPRMAGFEVERYLGWPAQALAFRVGARLFAEIKAEAEAAAGPAFDSRAFHNQLLATGPMGLAPLRSLLLPR
jgi:uncharacterized protein (DUF885 family)